MIGQFVSATSTKPYGAGAGPGHGFSKESREVWPFDGESSSRYVFAGDH